VIAVLLQPVTDEVLTTTTHIVRLSASDECTAYEYLKHGGEFLIGTVTALAGAFAAEKAVVFLGILAGTGIMVLAGADLVHCGIH
jgi:hypothetical protein